MSDLSHHMSSLSIDSTTSSSSSSSCPSIPRSRSIRQQHPSTCTCYSCSHATTQTRLLSWATSSTPPCMESSSCDKPWLLPCSLPNSPPIVYRRVARPITLPARPVFDDDDDVIADKTSITTPIMHTWNMTQQQQQTIQLQQSFIQQENTWKQQQTHQSMIEQHHTQHTQHTQQQQQQQQHSSSYECKSDCESPNTHYPPPTFHWRDVHTPTSITV